MESGKTVLFTGGSGLLGSAMQRLCPNFLYPASNEFDITNYASMLRYAEGKVVGAVLHAAAFTSPPKIDADPMRAVDVNIVGTANVVKLCASLGCRLVYVSTDYVFRGDVGNYREEDPVSPVNKYAWSKLGGECAVRLYNNALIVRTTFGPEPFPYEKAFIDQWTSREVVSEIARKLIPLIDSDIVGTLHVGGERRSVYEYALSAAQGRKIGELSINDISFQVPADTSLDCSRYREIFP